jgi:hypothetical protein
MLLLCLGNCADHTQIIYPENPDSALDKILSFNYTYVMPGKVCAHIYRVFIYQIIQSSKTFINDQYRICFFWRELGVDAVEIIDYH